MNKNRLFLALILLGFVVLVFPVGLISPVIAENPTATNVFAADTEASGTVGAGTRHHALRNAASDGNPAHRAWTVAPGASITLNYREYTSGTGAPAGPDGDADDICRLQIYSDNSANVIRTLHSATTCPVDDNTQTYAVYCTSNGLSNGNPRAGTMRIRVEAINRVAGIPLYSADSDAEDKGAIRCGADVASITVSAYPNSGSTFAYTIAGESPTWTIGITASHTSQVRTYRSVALDSANALPPGFTGAISTIAADTTSYTLTAAISDSWPAGADNYGLRVMPEGNSALTAVRWTHINGATAPVVVVSDTHAQRPTFYNVDPRVSATHLMQVNSGSFSTPPMTNNIGDTRTLPDIGYIGTRFVNARNEGLVGSTLAYTRTLQDNGAVLAPDTLTCAASCIGTQGGETGWSPLFIWNAGGPVGQWNKAVDITGPSTINSNAHLLVSTQTLFLQLPDGDVIYNITEEMGDPLKVFAAYHEPSNTVKMTISESYLNGNARAGNAAGTTIYVYDPADNLFINGANPTEIQFGSYRYSFTPDEPGQWLILIRTLNETGVPVGTSNIIEVDSMTNEYLDAALVFAPLIILAALIIWAEITREFFIYLLAIIAGGLITIFGEWTDLLYLRVVFVAVLVLVALRAALALQDIRNQENIG